MVDKAVIQEIFQTEEGKWKLRKAFQEFYREQQAVQEERMKLKEQEQSESQQTNEQKIIDQISEVIVDLLDKKATQYALNAMSKIEEMYFQQEKRFTKIINVKLEKFKKQCKEIMEETNGKGSNVLTEETNILQKERSAIKENLLDCSNRLNPNKKAFLNVSGQSGCSGFSGQSRNDESTELLRNMNSQHNLELELSQRLDQFESKNLKQFTAKMQKKMKMNLQSFKEVNNKVERYKAKMEEIMEAGFNGVWNVISDIENKVILLNEQSNLEPVEK